MVYIKNKNYKAKILFMKGAWNIKWNFKYQIYIYTSINDRLLSSVQYISVTVQLAISIGQSIVQVTISRRFHKSSVQL